MQSKRTLIIVLAVALMVMVMIGAVAITLTGTASRAKYQAEAGWSTPASAALSLNITDLTGDKERDIFVQDTDSIKLLDLQGNLLLEKRLPPPIASTMGDLDGDGTPDIVAYTWNGENASVIAFTGQDRSLWQLNPPELGLPGRATVVDFDADGRSEVVVGSQDGYLVALSAQGEPLWQYELPAGASLRGLDDVALPAGRAIAAGDERGLVVVLDGQGREMWRTEAGGGLRRLRSFPLGGRGYVLVGSVDGTLTAYPGASGQVEWTAYLGQAVNEIRPAELDGDPATTELIAAGKNGGVWAFNQAGEQLWAASVGEKVNEIAAVDNAGSGRQEIITGDDGGSVTIFDPSGRRLISFRVQGSVGRLDAGKLGEPGAFLVADAAKVTRYTLSSVTAPFWYTPVLGGLLACIAIAVVAFGVASFKPAPTVRVSAEEMTVEAQKARRRMLHESIQDLKKIQERGEVSGQAYLARLKELRQQLADVNATLIKLGEPVQVESFACPHCGGPLELGTDRCEYCGQVVIV